MNKLNLLAGGTMLLLLSLSACKAGRQQDDLQAMIAHGLNVATEQSLSMARQLENEEGRLPRSVKDGKLDTSDNQCWCSGFYPGVL